jgi:hypothetical protein
VTVERTKHKRADDGHICMRSLRATSNDVTIAAQDMRFFPRTLASIQSIVVSAMHAEGSCPESALYSNHSRVV